MNTFHKSISSAGNSSGYFPTGRYNRFGKEIIMRTALPTFFIVTIFIATLAAHGDGIWFRSPVFMDVPELGIENKALTNKASTAIASASSTTNSLTASDADRYIADDKYKLRIGDKISFQILEDRDAPKSLLIADSGELDVPYIGRVTATDKTCKQLAQEIKTLLEKDFYYHANVVLSLDSANRLLGRIYVWGQVRNQGPIDIAVNENLTAGKAILRAGGFGDFANKKKVRVVRAGNGGDTSHKQNFELNLAEILEDGKTEKDIVLQPDDFIIVPSRLINF